ncbi:hypothetical protein DL98DRAFT_581395 [Cadophora sp. DSE1049]|nr:hypothetical protein DL98DRAFT_581395 [Cadophora sp. DSE1049]
MSILVIPYPTKPISFTLTMCHLCRKAQALESLNNKALKPVVLALARLHRTVEPNLCDFWTWRYDATLRLRKALRYLHKVVHVSALTEMIKEVDDELLHCEKHMAEHPAVERRISASSGSDGESEDSLTPSESVSAKARKRREEEAAAEVCIPRYMSLSLYTYGCPTQDKTMKDDKSSRILEEKRDSSYYHLSGSDLDPHPLLVKRSCLIVEAWLEKCDAAAATSHEQDLDSVSVVSVPGGFHE